LKNAAKTGPFARASFNENCFPSMAGKVKSGAAVPGFKAGMFLLPPNKDLNQFIG
jgi:hypothetical protein